MYLPTIFAGLEQVAKRLPQGAWSSEQVTWYVDQLGFAHGRSGHGPGPLTMAKGTLATLLGSFRCDTVKCISLARLNPSSPAMASAEAAQSYGALERLVQELRIEADLSPGSLHSAEQSRKETFERLHERLGPRLRKDPEIAALCEDLRQEMLSVLEQCRRLITSDQHRETLTRAAVEHLLFSVEGPLAPMRERLEGAAVSGYGEEPECPENWEQLDDWLERIESFHPTLISQLVGLTLDNAADPTASARRVWMTSTRNELLALRDRLNLEGAAWLERRDLVAVDMEAVEPHDRGPKMMQFLKHRHDDRSSMSTMHDLMSLFERFASAQGTVAELTAVFRAQLEGIDNTGRVVVLPAALAFSLTSGSPYARVELGVERIGPAEQAALRTSTALLSDGGMYETLQEAWQAARLLG